jgi:hypothetical protein
MLRSTWTGLKRILGRAKITGPREAHSPISRRRWLTACLRTPVVGGLAWAAMRQCGYVSHEERLLADEPETDPVETTQVEPDAVTAPSQRVINWRSIDDLKGRVPKSKIGDLKLSRMILGGNLIGGWAHARDLIYVSDLVKAYHTKEKIFGTFHLAEACGINTILTNPFICEMMQEFWTEHKGRIQFISDCGGSASSLLAETQKSIDAGASACYVQGAIADKLVETENFDLFGEALELVRSNGLPAGIGAHKLATVKACVERGYKPDFWMKTLHHTNYWSAQNPTQHDNIWSESPEETVAYMNDIEEPWIAFKVLAAGAIHPRIGFKYAFESGADFICVGMYDFQMVDNVNLVLNVLDGDLARERPWRTETV